MKLLRCLLPATSILIALLLAGCVFDGGSFFGGNDSRETESKEQGEKDGFLSRMGGWFGEDKESKEPEEVPAPGNTIPIPQQLPIGSVHLVHGAGGFVLIRTSRSAEIDPQAELVTFNPGGRPTSRLRLSPERKGGFLVADIIEGNPQANDRVVMYGYLDSGGTMRFDAADPDQPEVLE